MDGYEGATMTHKNCGRVLFRFSLLLCLSLACSSALAVFRGEPDSGRHPYAGLAYLYLPNAGNYLTCSGALVDAPQLPDRQVFLTAGHCLFFAQALGGGTRWSVTFDETPGMVFGDPTSRFPTSLSPDFTLIGTGYTEFSTQSSGIGVGSGKVDYGIILLDDPVDASMVPQPAALPSIGLVDDLFGPEGTAEAREITMVGYGIELWSTGGGRPPVVLNGPREKSVITLGILSLQKWNILEQMHLQQGDMTACNGDSGAAGIVRQGDSDTAVAVTANGDSLCRATNTMTRVDTPDFYRFLNKLSRTLVS
jgi:hypothetical protein